MPAKVEIVKQRRAGDCGVAALAAYLHVTYEEAYVAAVKVAPKVAKSGLLMREILATAKGLGRPLRVVRRPDLEAHSGILGVLWNKPKQRGAHGHWVVLSEGKILDSSPPEMWDADEYLKTFNGRPGWLLTEDKGE